MVHHHTVITDHGEGSVNLCDYQNPELGRLAHRHRGGLRPVQGTAR